VLPLEPGRRLLAACNRLQSLIKCWNNWTGGTTIASFGCEDLLAWSEGLHVWQRDALGRLLTARELTDTDIAALAERHVDWAQACGGVTDLGRDPLSERRGWAQVP